MTLPASEETVPATDAEIAKLEHLATITDMCGHDASVLALIARIKLERQRAIQECAEKSYALLKHYKYPMPETVRDTILSLSQVSAKT